MACGRQCRSEEGGKKQFDDASSGPEQARGPELVEGLKRVEGPSRINFPSLATNPLIQIARQLAPSVGAGRPVVYFLRLRSGIIYIGASADFEQRLEDHASGQACRTTALNPPIAVVRIETCPKFTEARRREAQLKRWSRAKKEALICGDAAALKALSRSRD